MAIKIFVNLPVSDLGRSIEFYAALGWPHNPDFTGDKVSSIVISEDIYLMVVTEDFFATLTKDAPRGAEAVIALNVESKERVDELVDTALANGGSVSSDPTEESFMYGRGFADPDGHRFEVVHMFGS
jgi:uncharacterized protein